jgi:hypothetical protein
MGGGGAGATGGTGGAGRMMTSDDSPPKSMASGRVMTNAMGQTMAPLTVSSPAVPGGSGVEVTVPMGTELRGPTGLTLSGEATVTVNSYNLEPEGVTSFRMENMTPAIPGDVVVGQVAVAITVGGMPVASGSQPIETVIIIPDGARDEAGMPYTPATVVSDHVYDDGAWKTVATGPLSAGGTESKRTPNGAVNRTALRNAIRARLLAAISRFSRSPTHGEGN